MSFNDIDILSISIQYVDGNICIFTNSLHLLAVHRRIGKLQA